MSLRQRLLLAVAAALIGSLAVGTWITAWEARYMVRAELSASLKTARRNVAAALQDMAEPPPHDALLRLVAGFDGSQHVVAELVVDGKEVARSNPALAGVKLPEWFAAVASPALAPVDLPVATGVLRLTAVPASEIAERWAEARRLIALLALSSALAAIFCFVTAAWGLRPLQPLADAFSKLEKGRRSGPVGENGPPEIGQLAASFNRMQEALAQAAWENRRLSAQLDRLAEEERAELARDLHDEIGPLLFALTAWAAAARMQEVAGDGRAALVSLQSLEDAAAALQNSVRDLLRRLRDSDPANIDLVQSLQDLLAFWRGIRPQTNFAMNVAADADRLREPARAALFRVAQEGISNAIRHGNPNHVLVAMTLDGQKAALMVQDDGTAEKATGSGLGLVGLEERLQALGGGLDVCRQPGWRITGWVPAEEPSPS